MVRQCVDCLCISKSWSVYQMLKPTIKIKNNVNTKNSLSIIVSFIEKDGMEANNLQYLQYRVWIEAPDDKYVLMKVSVFTMLSSI